jgi:hypothetical protein
VDFDRMTDCALHQISQEQLANLGRVKAGVAGGHFVVSCAIGDRLAAARPLPAAKLRLTKYLK